MILYCYWLGMVKMIPIAHHYWLRRLAVTQDRHASGTVATSSPPRELCHCRYFNALFTLTIVRKFSCSQRSKSRSFSEAIISGTNAPTSEGFIGKSDFTAPIRCICVIGIFCFLQEWTRRCVFRSKTMPPAKLSLETSQWR